MGAARPQAVPLRRARGYSFRRAVLLLVPTLLVAAGLTVLSAPFFAPSAPPLAVYREAVVGEPVELDPLIARQRPRDPDPTPLLFRGLVQVDERGRPSPDLAESWSTSAEGRIYRFTLRPGLTWDDGQPLTAADVLFSVRRAARVGDWDRTASFWAAVEARAVADDQVEFVLREPLGAFLEHATLPIVAEHAPPIDWDERQVGVPAAALVQVGARPAVNGPYRPADGEPTIVRLERNPGYHGPPPALDRVEFHPAPDRAEAIRMLRDGRVDALADLTPDELNLVADSDRLVVYRSPEYGKHGLLILNAQTGPFRDRAVRQAAAHAIDRRAVVEVALEGRAEVAAGPLSPLSWASQAGRPDRGYDPAAARSLLASAGWQPDGPSAPPRRDDRRLEITLVTSDVDARRREAETVADQLRRVGFDVVLRPVPADRLVRDHLEAGRFDAALVGRWMSETDPDQFVLWHSTQAHGLGGNYGGISAPELDRWLELGRQLGEPAARADAYRRFQSAWAEEQPAVLLYHPHTAYAVSREIQGLAGGPLPDASWRLRRLPEWSRQPSQPPPLGWPLPLAR